MNSVKSVCSFLGLLILPSGLLCAQTSGTATTPTSTTSTNRQQELYDQYHGYNKKNTTAAPAATPATAPQRRARNYGNGNQSTATVGQPQRVAIAGSETGPRIGVRGGVTYTFFTEQQPFLDPKPGFVGGVTFNFGSGTVSFQPEVNYARYNYSGTNPFTNLKITGAYDQIEVPLFLKISSGTYANSRFFVNVGPYGSYLASTSTDGKKESLSNAKGRFGFGAALGLGAALKTGPGHVTIEARGLYSFGNTASGISTDSRAINSQLTVGYSFPLGGR